jgi:hypothetical protein
MPVRATPSVFGLRVECGKAKRLVCPFERVGCRVSVGKGASCLMTSGIGARREERWGDLCGPDAATRRLQDIEMHLGQVRIELREIARWTEDSACPDISAT